MTKKMNARQLREQQKIAEKEKYARKAQLERERKKEEEAAREAEIAAEKRRRRIEAICKEMNENNEPIKSDKKSSAKAAGVKSVFAVDDAVYMTSFGRGNDAVLEKKIISGSHENINCDEPAFTLTNVAADKYEIESSRVKSLNATSDNPVHHGNDQPNAVFSDMLELKSPLETRVYGKTFDNDNIHIQLIYNILDIEKILALYSTNAIYALNNLLNKNDQTDIFERMMTDNTYKEICDPPEDRYKANRQELKAFMDSLIKNPRLAYYGTAFYIPNDNKSVLRSEKEIYDILALLGKLRHWCIHGNESNRKWLYSLDDNDFLAPEFKKIMDKLYDGAIDKLNKDFVKTNKVNIQILEAIFSNEDHAELVQEYYDFIVTKKYKNIGFSIKKLREGVIANTDIRDNKYNSVRPKLYKLIDFIIWHRYLHDDAAEADRLVNELRDSEDNAYKELIYIEESERLWDKCSDDILSKVVPAIDKENIKDLTKTSLDEVSIDIIKGSNVLANTVRDVCLVKSSNCALSHVVVLSVDYVEGLAGVDNGLNDLLSVFSVPFSGLLCNDVPVSFSSSLFVESTGSADLSSGAHYTLDMYHIVFGKPLRSEPINSCLTFLSHIGNDRSFIEAGICINCTVKKNYLYALVLCILKNAVPTGSTCCGNKEIVNLVLNELLCRSDLLVVLKTVCEGSTVAVCLGKGILHILIVSSTVAGLIRVVVDNADLDK